MKRQEVEELYKKGVFTENERDNFLAMFSENDKGELIGGYSVNNNLITKYEYEGDIKCKDEPLWKYVYKHINPPLGAEQRFAIFDKYGFTITGIYDDYKWYTSDTISAASRSKGCVPIDEAPEYDLWKIIALTSRYWEVQYKRWLEYR